VQRKLGRDSHTKQTEPLLDELRSVVPTRPELLSEMEPRGLGLVLLVALLPVADRADADPECRRKLRL
jgi:hypothetical protein